MKNKEKGITLIALVITIIVLLILAGVAIATLTGDNGILTKAVTAKENTEKANEDEMRRLTMLEAVSNIENKEYTDANGDTATIPAGFAVSQIQGENTVENTVENGLVIVDVNGNEFVWIPVPTAIAESEEQGTINKAMAVNLGTKENPQYRGLLYDFTNEGSTVKNGCTTTTSDYREPDIVSDYDNNTTYNNGLFTKESLQNDYNNMIESVNINHGFYVSRYEMSLDENKNAQSKKNQPSATADAASANMWYGLYEKAKTYDKASIVSGMIWGSQYDAMMNWMNKDSNVTVNSPISITGAIRNESRITGSEENDKIKNVYDLLGNSFEWTLENSGSDNRLRRGGCFGDVLSPANNYWGNHPNDSFGSRGCRFVLYIK